LELILGFLIERADSRVDGSFHCAPQSGAGGTPLRGPRCAAVKYRA
jgi:hypothetical protein